MKLTKENLKELLENTLKDIENIDEKELEEISESLTMSVIQRSREAKINAAVGAIAVSLAKKNNDPLYHKLIKYRRLWKETKQKIIQKYGPKAYQQWVQNQAKK